MQRFDALSFDLDNTLLDSSDHHQSILGTCEAIVKQRPGMDLTALMEANARTFASYWAECIDDWTLGRLSGESLGLESWRRTLEECGVTDESMVSFAVMAHRQLARKTYRLYTDVREIIDVCVLAQIPMALVTNGASDTQRAKLEAMGIANCFDVLAISGEIGVAKPDPGVFAPVLKSLGVEGKRVWHVGDSLATDVLGAHSAGLTSVWLNRNGEGNPGDIKPDLTIRSLTELKTFLPDFA